MPEVTTQSGQAGRDLIALVEQAREIVRAERERAARLQAVIDATVRAAEPDQLGARISTAAWESLRKAASSQ